MNFAAAIYRHFYRKRKREAESRRVTFPEVSILSVGNITTGGTGKTPAVQWLARRLKEENLKTVIVGRGYGGEYSERGAVVCDGTKILLNARQAGDEAILHARALQAPGEDGVAVVIGRDRVAAVRLAIEKFAPDAIVLDDGFQYWSLARDFDLVLLDARRPFGNGKLLPAGRLREPIQALARADGLLLTRCDVASESEIQRARMALNALSDAPIFQASHVPVALRDEADGARLGLEVLDSLRIGAISALADNQSFFHSLKCLNTDVVSTLARRDHHAWREDEVREFCKCAKQRGASAIVTTEKDAVKMRAAWCTPLHLRSLVIEMKIEDNLGQFIDETLFG